jgi:hypothetical protein
MLPRMYAVPAQWMQPLSNTMDSSGSNSSHTTKQAEGAAQQQQAGSRAPSQSTAGRDGSSPAPGLVPIPYWLPDQGWSAMVAAGTWLSPGPAPAGV